MFPGQGNIYVGMGKELCRQFDVARRTFEEASDVLGMNLKEICFFGELTELKQTEISQPAILTCSIAALRVLSERVDLHPHYYAGHSLGEFSALTAAGALDFADALKLVRRRGELMRDAAKGCNGVMSAVGKIPLNIILDVCQSISRQEHIVAVSNYNTPKQNVISGHADAVGEAENELVRHGAFVKRLDVSAPFHSPLMQPAYAEFRELLESVTFGDVSHVLSNVTAREHTPKTVVENLAKQLVSPVRWMESMQYMESCGVQLAIDMGPKDVMKKLMLQNYRSVKALAMDIDDDREELEILIRNDQPIPFVSRCLGLAVAARNRCAGSAMYQSNVVRPYESLRALAQTIEAENRQATELEMKQARELLLEIFNGKCLPEEQQDERLRRLYIDTETETLFA